jgi:hypothetical protein
MSQVGYRACASNVRARFEQSRSRCKDNLSRSRCIIVIPARRCARPGARGPGLDRVASTQGSVQLDFWLGARRPLYPGWAAKLPGPGQLPTDSESIRSNEPRDIMAPSLTRTSRSLVSAAGGPRRPPARGCAGYAPRRHPCQTMPVDGGEGHPDGSSPAVVLVRAGPARLGEGGAPCSGPARVRIRGMAGPGSESAGVNGRGLDPSPPRCRSRDVLVTCLVSAT